MATMPPTVVIAPYGARLHRQQGAALLVALLLLVAITLVGFAAARAALLQQQMAAYQYDREIAFQSAEAALRVAERRLITHPADVARDCPRAGKPCLANPFDEAAISASLVRDVIAGDGADQFRADNRAIAQPQYVVERMGEWPDPSATYADKAPSVTYYRVTARSSDPAIAGDRSVVVLQTVVRQKTAVDDAVTRVSWRELVSP